MTLGDKIIASAVSEVIEAIIFIVVIIFLEEINKVSPISISLEWIIGLWALFGIVTPLLIFLATERELNQFMDQF